jgi:hypothetical protein
VAHPTDEIIERVARLERQQAELQRSNHCLRVLTGGLAILAGAMLLMAETGPTSNRTVSAEHFVLQASDGTVRGAWGIADDGAVGLNLNDASGRTRLTLDLAKDGAPGLDLYDQNDQIRATLSLGPHGTPGFGLYDPNGKLRTAIDIPAAQTPGLAFYHQNGTPAWGVP